VADKKPIRWFVPQGGESFMGIAAYYLTHEENMRQSFSQPSRSITRMLPDGTRIDYIMNDVVDCIRISPPQRAVSGRDLGKTMTWDKLPPLESGTANIDLSAMTVDPDVTGGYYCVISVVNGTDENGKRLLAEFSINASHTGWSIYQGTRQDDGTYKADGTNATLRLYEPLLDGTCDIIADDGRTKLKKTVNAFKFFFYYLGTDGLYYEINASTGRLVPAVGKAAGDVSVSPFEFYGEQYLRRVDITYTTMMNLEYYYTFEVYSVTFLYIAPDDGLARYEVVQKCTTYNIYTVISTDDPNGASGSSLIEESYTTPIVYREDDMPSFWESEHSNTTVGTHSTHITIEGEATLPSFLVMQSPMSDGASVRTRAMKKPGEEVYFVVIENSATPTYKTVVWFINSTSYASYAFSYDLEWEGVSLLLDNVYYGKGI
jgi:hypothetical protein